MNTITNLKFYQIDFGCRYIVSNHCTIYDTSKNNEKVPVLYISNTGYVFYKLTDVSGTDHILRMDHISAYNFKTAEYVMCYDKFNGDITILHIDGDNLNNAAHNLDIVQKQEVWKTIRGPEIKPNMYEISSFGRIRNMSGKILSLHRRGGYLQANLQTLNSVTSQKTVHRLVATAFIQNEAVTKQTVNHIDGDKTNNYVENLEWVSQRENIIHAFRFGLETSKIGSDNPSAVINESTAKHIWLLLIDDDNELKGRPKTNGSPTTVKKYLADEGLDVPQSVITNIKSGKVWRHLTQAGYEFPNIQSVINESTAKHIWLLLIDDDNELKGRPKTNGSPEAVVNILKSEGLDVKRRIVDTIRHGYAWKNVIKDLPPKNFNDLRCRVSVDIAKHIWLLLIDDDNELKGRPKTNGSPEAVVNILKSEGIMVDNGIVDSIKYKRAWKHITDMLPDASFSKLRPESINESTAKHIWLLLIDDDNELKGRPKTNGSPTTVKKYLADEGLDVSLYTIKGIKYKTSWRSVTDII